MSKGLGIGVLVVGLIGLGWWAHGHNGHRMEGKVRQLAEEAVAGSIHGMTTMVSGRDIHLSGIANGQDEADTVLQRLNDLPARRKVTSDLTVLETVTPYTFDAATDGTNVTASGHVPTEAFRGELSGLGDAAAGLKLAAGAPEGWGDLVKGGLAAMAALNNGTLAISDTTLTLTGEATSPAEAATIDAALAGLPAGNVTKNITLLDDGTPAVYTLDYDANSGATAAGKLPKGFDLGKIAGALGLGSVAGQVSQAVLGADGDLGVFAALKGWMGQIETLKLQSSPEAQKLDVGVQAGVDASAMQEALTGSLQGVEVAVATVTPVGENGARRINPATGAEQRFMGGYWVGVPQIEMGLAGCQAAADGLLSTATVNFVTGSDELDGSALQVVNDLAAIAARCAEDAGLKAVIGGHTDNVGDAAANLGLSQRRATAVRRELIARGVPAAALKAVGYGDTVAVADNATDEGRAKNRRTTFTWSQ